MLPIEIQYAIVSLYEYYGVLKDSLLEALAYFQAVTVNHQVIELHLIHQVCTMRILIFAVATV